MNLEDIAKTEEEKKVKGKKEERKEGVSDVE